MANSQTDYDRIGLYGMDLFTEEQQEQLIKNYSDGRNRNKHIPVAYLHASALNYQWLLTELDPNSGIAYGLIDLGNSEPGYGSVDLNDIVKLKSEGFRVFNNVSYKPNHLLEAFYQLSNELGILVAIEDGLEDDLDKIQARINRLEP